MANIARPPSRNNRRFRRNQIVVIDIISRVPRTIRVLVHGSDCFLLLSFRSTRARSNTWEKRVSRVKPDDH